MKCGGFLAVIFGRLTMKCVRATAPQEGLRTLVMRPARLTACRDALGAYVDLRDEAEWIRDEDREPLARVRPLLPALEDLCADALRAALAAREPTV